MEDNTETPSTSNTESESRETETESGGTSPETGKSLSQDDVNRIVVREKAKLERKLRDEYEAKLKEVKKAPAKDESPPPDLTGVLQRRLDDLEFNMALAGTQLSPENRADLREAWGTKFFDRLLATYKTPAPAAPAKATPGMTPTGAPQADRETGLHGATAEDVERWRREGTLLKRAEAHREESGGTWTVFNKGLRKR